MSWVVTAIVATTAITVDTQMKAAKAQEIELEEQAKQEEIAGKSRELERRERLNKVLSQSIVGQATSGITAEGTPQSIALSTAKKVSLSEGLEGLSDRLRRAQLKRQASNARSLGRGQAASTLLKGTTQALQVS